MSNWIVLVESLTKEENEDDIFLFVEEYINKLATRGRICDRVFSQSRGVEIWQLLNFQEAEVVSLKTGLEENGKYSIETWSRGNLACLSLIEVIGMTCQSCVKLIESGVRDMQGVSNIKVLLDKKLSITQHHYTTTQQISSTIYDMGFDVEILSSHLFTDSSNSSHSLNNNHVKNGDDLTSSLNKVPDDTDENIFLNIDLGDEVKLLTSLENGQDNISEMTNKNSILKKENGLTNKHTKSNNINNKHNIITNNKHKNKKKDKKNSRKDSVREGHCYLEVEGMTCGSCVAHIEQHVAKQEGITSIVVSLMARRADVTYDSSTITDPSIIASHIKHLGFNASILQPSDLSTITFHVAGVRSLVEATEVEGEVKGLEGVVECCMSYPMCQLQVVYDPVLLLPRSLLKIIEGQGFSAKVQRTQAICHHSINYSKEINKWRRSMVIGFLVCLPTIIYMLTSMLSCNHHHHHLNNYNTQQTIKGGDGNDGGGLCHFNMMRVVGGLSMKNTILFLFTTPVQWLTYKRFYLPAWRVTRHGQANMDVLVTLASLISYSYSLIIIIVSVITTNLRHHSSLDGGGEGEMGGVMGAQSGMNDVKTFFETAPMLLFFISFGRWLENKAKDKTSESLSKLISLQCSEATLVELKGEEERERGGEGGGEAREVVREEQIQLELVQKGDVLKVGVV